MARDTRSPVNKWAVAVAAAVVLVFLYVVRLAVVPFFIAAAIAYVAEPANLWLRRRLRLSRAAAAVTTFVVIMLLLGGLGYWAVDSLSLDLGTALHDAPRLLHKFFAEMFGGEETEILGRRLNAGAISQQIVDSLLSGFGGPKQVTDLALYFFGFGAITAAVLIIVLIFYFLHAGPQIAAGLLWLVPPEYRGEVH